MLHLHRGTPYVYQGDELGMTNAPFAGLEDFRDLESINHFQAATGRGEDREQVLAALRYKSRDNARTPVQWDASEHAGFTTGTPWLPVNPNHTEINAAAQYDDPGSVFHHHRALIALRHDDATVVHGSFTMLLPEHPQLYAFLRTHGDDELLVVANLSDRPGGRRRGRRRVGPARCWTAVRATRRRGCWSRGRRGCAGVPRNRATPAGGCPGDE